MDNWRNFYFSNSWHLEWRAGLWDTILKETHPGTIPARFGLIWFSSFRGEDLNVIFYQISLICTIVINWLNENLIEKPWILHITIVSIWSNLLTIKQQYPEFFNKYFQRISSLIFADFHEIIQTFSWMKGVTNQDANVRRFS